MATKTFKIGLSNTDKQNMAQDVYERLLALTFPEYDTDTSYDVGDFVVYNDQLYKCIGATSGAWDSTKWQLATLNDLLTDIEDAVAFVNDKANVDGNYPTMTVGVADQLSPYDDESGDDQNEPFSFQATGTGNGSQPDFSTGAIALMKEKQGNTVVVNQLAKEINNTNYGFNNASGSFSSGVATFTATAQNGQMLSTPNYTSVANHTYLLIVEIKLTTETTKVYVYNNVSGGSQSVSTQNTTNKQLIFIKATATQSGNSNILVRDTRTSDWDAIAVYNIYLIDLTQWFNGDIPQDLLDNPENFFRYYQGSLAYNTGELVNANGRYIKCIGRQQWDGEYTDNSYIAIYGSNTESDNAYFYTDYIRVIPNTTYYFKGGISGEAGKFGVFYYDKDKTPDGEEGHFPNSNNGTFTTGPNTFFIRCNCQKSITTPNQVCISLYYEGESGYDQYYPYEVLTNNDTGTETLRSAGSVKDIKLPSGEIKRNVGTQDLSQLSWAYSNDAKCWTAAFNLIKLPPDHWTNANMISNKYSVTSLDGMYGNENKVGFISCDKYTSIYCNNGSTTTEPSGTLFYELAEPTTEQGTLFSENLVIDDFGSMDFSGTNGVPQGNLIFYPVDYKAFIDTLYDYVEGTPSELVKQSERTSDKSAQATLDTALQNAIGGTLRQCLCVKESLEFLDTAYVDLSTLSYSRYASGDTETHYRYISSGLDSLAKDNAKNLCSNIKTGSANAIASEPYLFISGGSSKFSILWSKTAETFSANKLKGVLLAYEKASE